MRKFAFVAVAGLLSASAFADQGDILARFRVIDVAPQTGADGYLATLNPSVKSDTVPEVDFTYMITNNVGAELILGTSRHDAHLDALGADLGKISVLPPTLTLQYHFTPQATFRPYVGAGINYTYFYDNDLHVGASKVTVNRDSWGPALQVGADYAITKDWFVNVDVKKLYIRTDAQLNGAPIGTLKLDPWVYGIGIGTKF
ncbi:MAG: OmpW family protein [Paludibacterium sp.]|uniref:OmpW/AlkL family protein n=1 Tax=Paludibacterium sp. TaxID=1917523 RepID=UPI0025DFF014|nr:OmpW family outer membrane protein [Paludibacterium sp.]MBV8049396.1 OmpW family protein [Paludibacterium sp.]MBV8648021.1 OmpW family protein [Paludibacterium sp.]